MKNEAESKSQQRRIKAQTGQDVPLSAQAAEALAEGPTAAEAVTDGVKHHAEVVARTPKPGSPPKPAAKAPPPGSPILGIHEEMPSDRIRTIFETYRAAERNGSKILLDRISIDLGKKIGAAEAVRAKAFETTKNNEKRDRVEARKVYDAALRAAKSALDKENNRITDLAYARCEADRNTFQATVNPINVEMDAAQKKITNDYTAKIQAAVSELQPIAKKVQEKEEKRKADLRAKAEADAAAKAAGEVTPSDRKAMDDAAPMGAPHAITGTFVGGHTVPGLISGTGIDHAAAASVASMLESPEA